MSKGKFGRTSLLTILSILNFTNIISESVQEKIVSAHGATDYMQKYSGYSLCARGSVILLMYEISKIRKEEKFGENSVWISGGGGVGAGA